LSASDTLAAALARLAPEWCAGARSIVGVARLSGGASQETWAFDLITDAGVAPMILRRAPPGYRASPMSVGLEAEATLMQRAGEAGVPSPFVRLVLRPEHGLGRGFIMDRVEGETIARKILRDDAFAQVRPKLARQLGEILARIHAIDPALLPRLRVSTAATALAEVRAALDADGTPRPAFELALRWLADSLPPPEPALTLVHGDFRNGNLVVAPDGVRAVLDWELAHIGDPVQDIGWLCVNSWRYGEIDKPVGGFGPLEDLLDGYRAAGGAAVDPRAVRFWEIFGTLQWGAICIGMHARFRSGDNRSVELALISRRVSETEIDLLRLLAPR
jgi:aminoglycoside phosphotransferase (APT) family kinase protein